MLRDLIVPVQGNHNATLFLLGHVLNHPGNYSILLSKTDVVADRLIYRLCSELGVKIHRPEDIAGKEFGKVFVHPWNTESHPLAIIKFSELWIYADGLSNRVAMNEWEGAAGFLFWGDRAPFGESVPNSAQSWQLSSIESQREIWSKLLRFAGLRPRQSYVDRLDGQALVAMRYWGSSTYSSLSGQHVIEALNQFSAETNSTTVRVKLDSRWQHPLRQREIVGRSFPEAKIETFSNSSAELSKLGHLASLDTYLFTCEFPSLDFFGFDGSLPPTFLATQSEVKVFVPDMAKVMDRDLPIHAVVLENLEWHKSLRDHHFNESLGSALIFSRSLISTLAQARGEPVSDDAELARILRSMLFSNHTPVPTKSLRSLQLLAAQDFASSYRPSAIDLMLSRLKSSAMAQKVFYMSAQYLPLRRFLVNVSRLISRLSR